MVLEAEPLGETLAQRSLGAGQPAEVGQVVAHLLDEFHLLIQEVQRWGLRGEKPGPAEPQGLVRVLLRPPGGFRGVLGFTHGCWDGFGTSWKRARPLRCFCLSR